MDNEEKLGIINKSNSGVENGNGCNPKLDENKSRPVRNHISKGEIELTFLTELEALQYLADTIVEAYLDIQSHERNI